MAVVDAADADFAHSVNWSLGRRFDGKPVARENVGARRYLHIMIATRRHGPRPSPEHVCEHLNGDLLDCRAGNLRWSLKGETEFHKARRAA